ncbi:MAG TPA: hypothetical protein VFJ30_05205 [Phycisphaerae bacterium]|nr:hypothetical protein [Phycisphaerae bacterium]
MKTAFVLIGPALCLAAGCTAPGAVGGGQMPLSAANSAAFLDELSSQPQVTEAQAFRGLLLVLDNDRQMTFAEAVSALKQTGIVSQSWDFQADRPITRGKLAYMFYQACHMRGGLTLTLTGPSQRYCLRELQYRGYMAPGLFYNKVTGMEFIAVLTRADELRQTGEVSPVLIREDIAL